MTRIVVLEGDQTGQELLEEALRVLDGGVTGVSLELARFDLSLENRQRTNNGVAHEAARAMKECGFGLKAATITPEEKGSVGSPNSIVRREIDGTVILRTGRRIPGMRPLGGVYAPISVVRMAVGDAYGAEEWREGSGDDEVACRTERISRGVCRAVAEFAFAHARRTRAKVFGGPKYTVSPVYEGMLKEEMDAAATRYPDVRYEPQLIDATYALLLSTTGDALVIPALNRDGDCLSDFVLQLFGTIAGSESRFALLGRSAESQNRYGRGPARHGPHALRQKCRQPHGHDSGRRLAANVYPRPQGVHRVARHLRVGVRGRRRRRQDSRPRRSRLHL